MPLWSGALNLYVDDET